jgi:glycosyltransferase involved in cell wall biosynthesis
MGAAGRERATSRFSWRAVAEATASVYEEAVEKRAAPTHARKGRLR